MCSSGIVLFRIQLRMHRTNAWTKMDCLIHSFEAPRDGGGGGPGPELNGFVCLLVWSPLRKLRSKDLYLLKLGAAPLRPI